MSIVSYFTTAAKYQEQLERANKVFDTAESLPNVVYRFGAYPIFFFEDAVAFSENTVRTTLRFSLATSRVGIVYLQLRPQPVYDDWFPAFRVTRDEEAIQVALVNPEYYSDPNQVDKLMGTITRQMVIIPDEDSPNWGIFVDYEVEFAVFVSRDKAHGRIFSDIAGEIGGPILQSLDDVKEFNRVIFGERNPDYVKRVNEALETNYGAARPTWIVS